MEDGRHRPSVLDQQTPQCQHERLDTTMTDDELKEYSGIHVHYELRMLWEAAQALTSGRHDGPIHNALIESFAIHLRNLTEFFYDKPTKGYVRAQHFLDDPKAWQANHRMTPTLRQARDKANDEVSHLTEGRKPPGQQQGWNILTLVKEIQAVAKLFAAQASPAKLHGAVRAFPGLTTQLPS
jgi:hypothetical protein